MDYIIKESQPVVGMSSTDLLPSFYDGTAWLYEGRYPTSEEYVQGSAVCLVPKELLIIIICLWGIRLSQDFILQMRKKRQTGLCQAEGRWADFGILDQDGNLLRTFEEKNYILLASMMQHLWLRRI